MAASASPEIELTRELVALNTVNPGLVPGAPGERAAVELLATRLEPQGFAIEIVGPEDRPSLIATRRVTDGPLLAFNGHLDTVGVGGMVDPFVPRIEDGRMYGRGTCDMKAGVAACVVAAEAVPQANVVLTLVADEENDSLGTLAVLEHLGAGLPAACVVAEPTWLELARSHRGFSVVEVELRGRAAHSSRPHEGDNAIDHLGRLLHAVELPLMATLVRGGSALYTIPDRAHVTIEHRTQPGEPLHAGLDAVRALITRPGPRRHRDRAHRPRVLATRRPPPRRPLRRGPGHPAPLRRSLLDGVGPLGSGRRPDRRLRPGGRRPPHRRRVGRARPAHPLHDRPARDHSRMANIALTVNEDGSALLDLSGGGEIRESISLEDVPDGPPALESLVLHFDFYGRLARIEVTDSAASVLPPGLLDQA